MWLGFSVIHALVAFLLFGGVLFPTIVHCVFAWPPPTLLQKLVVGVFPLAGVVLFFGAPAFGYLWSKLYVGSVNRGCSADPTCRECGYNLTGNVSGICPECGAEVEHP
jgi:hypothetical protein